jgi:hypothetical protein
VRNSTFVQLSSAFNKMLFKVVITPWPPQSHRPVTLTFPNGPQLDVIRCWSGEHGEHSLTPVFTSRMSHLHQARTTLPAGRVTLIFELDWGDPDVLGCDRGLGPWEVEVRSDDEVQIPDVLLVDPPEAAAAALRHSAVPDKTLLCSMWAVAAGQADLLRSEASAKTPMGALVRVVAYLLPGWWRVIIGPSVGVLDGGSTQDWPEAWVPVAARRPNGEFRVSGFVGGAPQVVAE